MADLQPAAPVGIQETKEALIGLIDLAQIIGKEVKDGIQLSDLVAILNGYMADPVKKAEIDAALKDAGKIAGELKDISMSEGIELGGVLIGRLPGLLDALKAKAA